MARKERNTEVIKLLDSANAVNIPVLFTNGNVWTKSVYIGDAVNVILTGKIEKLVAGSSAKMTIQIEQGHELPAVEGSEHSSYVSNGAIMVTYTTAATYSHSTVTLVGLPYLRCKITPVTPNTSCYVNIVMSKQVEG